MYVKRCCSNCIFYSANDSSGYGDRCNINGDSFEKAKGMSYVSANDYDRDKNIAKEYDLPCEYYNSIKQIKNNLRKQYGIPEFYWDWDLT